MLLNKTILLRFIIHSLSMNINGKIYGCAYHSAPIKEISISSWTMTGVK